MTDTKMLKEMPKRIPINGTFELTVRCNLHCKMCLFRHDDSENEEIMQNELSAAQWIDMARQAAEAGTGSLLITGGEPMLRPDFCEIWEGIYKQGFLITLYTNATLINSQIMSTLRKFPPHRIGVTLYGASPETYEKVCGSASAFQKAINGINKLQELPSKLEFRTTIIKDNFSDVDKMEDIVKNTFHSASNLIETRIVMDSVRGAQADVSRCRLNAEDNIKLMLHRSFDQIQKKAKIHNLPLSGFKVKINPKISHDDKVHPISKTIQTFFGCDAGIKSYTISWEGNLIPCQMLGNFSIDITNQKFINAWEKLPFQIQLPNLCKKCSNCKYLDICPACPASRLAASGDMGGYVEYLCEDVKELLKYTGGKYE